MQEQEALDMLLELGIPAGQLRYIMEYGHLSLAEMAGYARKELDSDKLLSEIQKDFYDLARSYEEQAQKPPLFCAVPASSFTERETRFLWKPYLPEGEFTVMMAPGGTGKTFFVCALAAAVSAGLPLPGETARRAGEKVLLISAEDDGSILRGRLERCGADLEQVLLLDSQASQGLCLSEDFDDFREAVLAFRPKLVVIDPWHAFLGASADMNRANTVRPVFQSLANLCKDCGCAMLLLAHVNKRLQTENINNAAMGSADLVNAARSVLYLCKDPDANDCRLAVHSKANYAAEGESLRLRIAGGGAKFVGFSDVTREELELANRSHRSLRELRQSRQERQTEDGRLTQLLLEKVNPFAPVRITYDEFMREYGSQVFADRQPKRALEACRAALEERGVYLRTGLQLKRGGKSKNGFSLQCLAGEPEQAVLPEIGAAGT